MTASVSNVEGLAMVNPSASTITRHILSKAVSPFLDSKEEKRNGGWHGIYTRAYEAVLAPSYVNALKG